MSIQISATIRHQLLSLDWFKSLTPVLLEEVITYGRVQMYNPDQWLYGEGDIETGIATVLSGSISVWISIDRESSRLLSIGGPTTVIGQSRVLGGGDRLVTVTAREESQVFTLGDAAIERIAARHPELWKAMGKLFYHQLQNSVRMCAILALPGVQRVALRLCELHRTLGNCNDGQIDVGQYELADLSQVSRESLNAHLRKFEKNGWVQRGYMSILIKDLQALQSYSQ